MISKSKELLDVATCRIPPLQLMLSLALISTLPAKKISKFSQVSVLFWPNGLLPAVSRQDPLRGLKTSGKCRVLETSISVSCDTRSRSGRPSDLS